MKRTIVYLVCFFLLISTAIVFAEIKSLIKEYTYQASELDSKISCRAIALEQVKRELLEEMGTYIESTTVVQDAQIDKEEIKTISAGVVRTKILAENWDGKSFWLKAEVSADPNEVDSSIEKVRNDQKLSEELAESQAEKEEAMKEVIRLKTELTQSNSDKEKLAEYNKAVNQLQAADSFEEGTAMTVAGDYEGATKAYDRVISLRPEDPKAYFGRSIVYIYLGNYLRATQDLDRAMVIRPTDTNIYFQRASAYKSIREARLNDPNWRPLPGQPQRPIVPVPKQDPLKYYLDNKQTQHKLVKVNPFQPRQVIKKDPRQVPPETFRQKPEKPNAIQPVRTDIYRKGNTNQPPHLERKPLVIAPRVVDQPKNIQKNNSDEEQKRAWHQRQDFRKKDLHFVRQPEKPEVRKQVIVQPPNQPIVEATPSVAQTRAEREQHKKIKENNKHLKHRQKDNYNNNSSRRNHNR